MSEVPSGTELARPFMPAPKAPAMRPWGLLEACAVDPSGVLWHVAERREGAVQD